MRQSIRLAVLLVAGCVTSAAWAQDSCNVPYAPVVPAGEGATRAQILQARDDVTAFISQSDQYQNCLQLYLQQQEAAAQSSNRPMNESVRSGIMAKAAANQREKERVGVAFNQAVRAYNTANSGQ